MNNFIKNIFRIFTTILILLIIIGFFTIFPSIVQYCHSHNNIFSSGSGSGYESCIKEHGYKSSNSPFSLFIFFIFLLISVFFPDTYIIPLRNKWMDQVEKESTGKTENRNLFSITQKVGWTERLLYYTFLLISIEQFVIFLGIWLTLKTVVIYKNWEGNNLGEYHGARAKFYVFLIGSGLSIFSVILFFFIAKFIINY